MGALHYFTSCPFQSGNWGRPSYLPVIVLSKLSSWTTHHDATHDSGSRQHSLNSEKHDGWVILAFVNAKGFLIEKSWFRMLWTAITKATGGMVFLREGWLQSTAHFQAPSSPYGSFTYCNVVGAEGAPGICSNCHSDSSLHCLWRKEEWCPFTAQDLATMWHTFPGGLDQVVPILVICLRYMVENMCMIYSLVFYTPHLSPFIFFLFSMQDLTHVTNGMDLTL